MKEYFLISALCLALAIRDGVQYKLNGKHADPHGVWHGLGVVVYVLGCYKLCLTWEYAAFAALVRFGVYDVAYNLFAGFNIGHIGTTAKWDILNRKVFKNAIIKAAVSIFTIIIWLWIR